MAVHIMFTLKDFKLGGGIECVQQRLAGQFLKDGQRVSFFVMNGETPDVAGARILDGGGNGLLGLIKSIVLLRRIIRRESVTHLISAKEQANLCTWVATLGSRCQVIYTRHTALDCTEQKTGVHSLRLLYALYLCGSGKVVAVSHGLHQTIASLMPWGRERIRYCPNAVITEQLHNASRAPLPKGLPHDYWIGVGRLVEVKGFHLLLQAYALVIHNPDVPDLVIAGDGPLREELIAQARQLGIANRVHFTGHLNNPYPLIRHARLLILSSFCEGQPTVLIEALALGTPVLASDCPTGPRELLDNGRLGQLVKVNDVPDLAQALQQSLSLKARSARSMAHTVRPYTSEHAARAYYEVWDQ
ncbi:glycosyltransferase [Pseudomonas fluorescens]|uniref:glycosyltransferase n=1 Tax=Pseudomonas fluorescens TaxID=294 RepID=UPI0021ABA814|nr:glycosyltransferase [Pseudomonas fluorescens]